MFPVAALVVPLAGLIIAAVVAAAEPALPRVYIDTTYVSPTGKTIAVAAGGNFQAALAAAQPGDVITLAAGATYRGPLTLPNKPGAGWITIRTSAPDSSLPPGTPSTASCLLISRSAAISWGPSADTCEELAAWKENSCA